MNPSTECLNVINVPPSASDSRYCKLETAARDMNNGPVISSRVGRLIACTDPQKCPLLLPRSRYHLPPGQASIFMGKGLPSGVSLCGPICSSNALKVVSSG